MSLQIFYSVSYYLASNYSQNAYHIHWMNMSIMFLTTPVKQVYFEMSDLIEPVFPHTPIQNNDRASKHLAIDGLSFLDLSSIAN